MPEAIKEVTPEKTPEKIAAKEIKPAEASSGTLPADEQPLKDGEEGAVAPEVAAVETPEEGKSIPEPSAQQSAPASDGNGLVDSPKEEGGKSSDEPEKNSNGSCSEVVQPSADHETSKKSDSVKSEEPEKDPSETVMESSSDIKDGSNAVDKKDESKPVETSIKEEENTKGDLSTNESSENKEEEKTVVGNNLQDSCMNGDKSESSEKLVNETLEVVKETTAEVKDTSMETKVETPKESKVDDSSVETKVQESAVDSKDNDTAVESKETANKPEVEPKLEEMAVKSKGDETDESKTPASSDDTIAQPTSDIKADSENKKEPESQNNEVDSKMEIDTEGSKKQSGNSDSKIPVSESSSVENGKSEAGRSVDVDPVQVEEIKKLISDAKDHMISGEHFNAADLLGKACEIAGKLYGDLASENGELYYLYGCAMLECAKNENTVLGEAVKEEEASEDTMDDKEDDSSEQNDADEKEAEEVEKQNGEEPAVNGDEAMEVVEEEAEAEVSSKTNGVDSEATAVDGEKENEEEDDSSLKTAWEMFELAKVIFGKTENSSRLADTYIKLGEVGMESGHGDSIDDMKKALELRLSFASENHRLLAETHFNIGLAYATFQNFDSAIESFQQSKSLLEAKINKLKNSDKTKDSEDEIKELSGLLPDLDEKIQDMKDSKAAKVKGEEDSKQGGASSSETTNKPVSNISHLVKRKRKLEDVTSELLPNTKQPCTDVDKPESVKSDEKKSDIASNEDKPKENSATVEGKETPKADDSVKEECAPKEEKADLKKSSPLEPNIPMEETPSEEKSTTSTQKEEAASV